MKLYTKTGDQGKTDIKGERVHKDDVRIKIIGELDEFKADLGLTIVHIEDNDDFESSNTINFNSILNRTCYHLYLIMGYFSGYGSLDEFSLFNLSTLEDEVDFFQELTPPHPGRFIRSGIYLTDALLDRCRVKCRRVERKLTTINAQELLPYFNRLSDLLYAMQIYSMTKTNIDRKLDPYQTDDLHYANGVK
jgi:cob(I)alamin adenosyltransferase